MKKISKFSIFISLLLIIITLSCNKNSTKSSDINCNDLSIQNNSPYYPYQCSGVFSGTVSNIQYDQYGRRTSMDFDYSCSTSDKTISGRFYNMTYNSYGQLQTFEATINGKHCTYP